MLMYDQRTKKKRGGEDRPAINIKDEETESERRREKKEEERERKKFESSRFCEKTLRPLFFLSSGT